jgi:hypothetical protein
MMTYHFPVGRVIAKAQEATGLNFPSRGNMEHALRNSSLMINVIHGEAMKAQGRDPEEVVSDNDDAHYAIEELMISFTLAVFEERQFLVMRG